MPNPNSNNASILLGNGDGTFKTAVNYTVGQAPIVGAVGDFNGDGKLDLVVANNVSNKVSLLWAEVTKVFKRAVSTGETD
ncbi:MAG: FG-GAP repeat domain-containing protein [Candidatus Sulfotelmatobacter sp.]